MTPTAIDLHKKSGILELTYDDGGRFQLSAEFLRVHSPSAEVRGHGKGQEVLQIGKRDVAITAIRPVGNYAIRLDFSDGHNTGIFSWSYLRELCLEQDRLWQAYLDALEKAGASRDALPADTQVIKIQP
ncbi:MAG: gamma-butyrobetaine hydroxylase-like domain-containing protein [Pseudohongiellaceae bacterium]|jgi:DUF971 family protein